jgi:2-polyprenyl-3-methyl-5-hydroxy-6-metoxy-1,4-benzoquinol methylase
MEIISNCPICQSQHIESFLEAKDYTVSGEVFKIVQCRSCDFLFTNPRPSAKEAGKYYESINYISHSNTNEGIVNKLYHWVRNVTLKQKTNWIENFRQANELLDIGCGNGHFVKACINRGWDAMGMELDIKTSEQARKNTKATIVNQLQEIKESQQFQIISLWHVLEHVYELDDYFRFFTSHLKPNGKLLIALPNPKSHDADKFKAYWAAYDVPRHIHHFTPKSIELLAKKYGFKLIQTKGLLFDSFYISLLSNEYESGHKKLISSFITGAFSNLKAFIFHGNYSSNLYIFEHAKK